MMMIWAWVSDQIEKPKIKNRIFFLLLLWVFLIQIMLWALSLWESELDLGGFDLERERELSEWAEDGGWDYFNWSQMRERERESEQKALLSVSLSVSEHWDSPCPLLFLHSLFQSANIQWLSTLLLHYLGGFCLLQTLSFSFSFFYIIYLFTFSLFLSWFFLLLLLFLPSFFYTTFTIFFVLIYFLATDWSFFLFSFFFFLVMVLLLVSMVPLFLGKPTRIVLWTFFLFKQGLHCLKQKKQKTRPLNLESFSSLVNRIPNL